jgi:ADP-heptose:LPS heptosyltransferase
MRILIARLGRAGDMVMITPALKALIQHFPDAEFTLLTSPDGKRLLNNYHSHIKHIWVWNRSSLTASIGKREIARKLRENVFDKIFCFETNPSITALFNTTTAEFYGHVGTSTLIHCAQIYLNIVARACAKLDTPLWVHLPDNKKAALDFDKELLRYGITELDTLVTIHPTYSGYSRFNLRKRSARIHKLWPTEKYASLAQQLTKLRLPNGSSPRIIIDLLDNEMPVGKKIIQQAGKCVQLINEKPNFERYKALLKRTNLLISPDTGPMHIAAAVGTRIVALFSGKDPADCGPFIDSKMFNILRAEDTKHPEQGIAAIEVHTVYNACVKQLNVALEKYSA